MSVQVRDEWQIYSKHEKVKAFVENWLLIAGIDYHILDNQIAVKEKAMTTLKIPRGISVAPLSNMYTYSGIKFETANENALLCPNHHKLGFVVSRSYLQFKQEAKREFGGKTDKKVLINALKTGGFVQLPNGLWSKNGVVGRIEESEAEKDLLEMTKDRFGSSIRRNSNIYKYLAGEGLHTFKILS